jgi:hypothetical protein
MVGDEPRERLALEARFADPDAAYRMIVEAHRGLDDKASEALNAALVLALANHIGDLGVLEDAIALARRSLPVGR